MKSLKRFSSRSQHAYEEMSSRSKHACREFFSRSQHAHRELSSRSQKAYETLSSRSQDAYREFCADSREVHKMVSLLGPGHVVKKAIGTIFGGDKMFPPGSCHHEGACHRGEELDCRYYNPDVMTVSEFNHLHEDEIAKLATVLSHPPPLAGLRRVESSERYHEELTPDILLLPKSLKARYPRLSRSRCKVHRLLNGPVLRSLYEALRYEIEESLHYFWLPLSRLKYLSSDTGYEEKFVKLQTVRELWTEPHPSARHASGVLPLQYPYEDCQCQGCIITTLGRDSWNYVLLGAMIMGLHPRANEYGKLARWCEESLRASNRLKGERTDYLINEMHVMGDILRAARLRLEADYDCGCPCRKVEEESCTRWPHHTSQGEISSHVPGTESSLRGPDWVMDPLYEEANHGQDIESNAQDSHSPASTTRLNALYTEQGTVNSQPSQYPRHDHQTSPSHPNISFFNSSSPESQSRTSPAEVLPYPPLLTTSEPTFPEDSYHTSALPSPFLSSSQSPVQKQWWQSQVPPPLSETPNLVQNTGEDIPPAAFNNGDDNEEPDQTNPSPQPTITSPYTYTSLFTYPYPINPPPATVHRHDKHPSTAATQSNRDPSRITAETRSTSTEQKEDHSQEEVAVKTTTTTQTTTPYTYTSPFTYPYPTDPLPNPIISAADS